MCFWILSLWSLLSAGGPELGYLALSAVRGGGGGGGGGGGNALGKLLGDLHKVIQVHQILS